MRYREQRHQQDVDEDGALDLNIVGDEQEQHRIQLENNLQDISIQLSTSNPSHASDRAPEDDYYLHNPRYEENDEASLSLEHPRHNSNPRDESIFHGRNSSFLDGSHADHDYESHIYSYRTVDDDDIINPYGGDTMSTAAHHASALTLRAGLGGRAARRASRTDISLSGAEYDPDRSLQNMVNGLANMSVFDMSSKRNRSKNKSQASLPQVTFDPLIVETSDRHFPDNYHPSHPLRTSSSTSASELNTPDPIHIEWAPTRLSDNLRRLETFSPKRPSRSHMSSPARLDGEPTPKARQRSGQPAVSVQPPTPSTTGNGTGGSKFSRLAKGLAREIEESERMQISNAPDDRIQAHSTMKAGRSPFQNIGNHHAAQVVQTSSSPTYKPSPKKSPSHKATRAGDRSRNKDRVQLPDVTGLTSAVGSPVKGSSDWRGYAGGDEGECVEEQVLQTLTSLQTRLNQLESQNLVSRRRVRELEMELESCKADVKRERTRVLEREEIIVAQQREVQQRRKGKSKLTRTDESLVDETRYKEVVEEKKALEALIGTLRSHLTRLTSELSSHQAIIAELRSLRESDVQAMRDKMAEVDKLRMEVERLGGEVEVLRGVIEEGLKERRRVKETLAQVPDGQASILTHNMAPGFYDHPANGDGEVGENQDDFPSRQGTPTPLSRPQSRTMQHRPNLADKTMRTDRATLNSSQPGRSTRFIGDDELDRVSMELEERRSERSSSQGHLSIGQSSNHSRASSSREQENPQPANESGVAASERSDVSTQNVNQASRPSGPTPARASRRQESCSSPNSPPVPETPFPQIRGEQLERLFFSAPEHNVRTCTVCHRRQRPDADTPTASWLPARRNHRARAEEINADEDEGFAEGSEDVAPVSPPKTTKSKEKVAFASEDRLPPQTVLARVLRELEDDFTHYKGIYVELADQYKLMDAASNVPKRNVLAEHLKEVIETLEQKGDQIASLYDLLTFKDKAIPESIVSAKPMRHATPPAVTTSWSRQRSLRKQPTYS